MSFSFEVKNELINAPRNFDGAHHAFSYGVFLFAGAFRKGLMYLRTENTRVAELYAELAESIVGRPCTDSVKSRSGVYTVSVVEEKDRLKILKNFGCSENEIKLRINRSNIGYDMSEDRSCEGAFLAGAFLSCGMITDPQRNYRLEFLVGYKNLCTDILKMLRDIEVPDPIEPKQTVRKSNYVIYIKNSRNIEDTLTFMGAGMSALSLMETKVYKDIRNKVNRISNCESANLDKTLDAGFKQVEAINKIKSVLGEEGIPENLRELARLRLENPQMSLTQLASELNPPISRSGVNHRLNKLLKIAQEL